MQYQGLHVRIICITFSMIPNVMPKAKAAQTFTIYPVGSNYTSVEIRSGSIPDTSDGRKAYSFTITATADAFMGYSGLSSGGNVYADKSMNYQISNLPQGYDGNVVVNAQDVNGYLVGSSNNLHVFTLCDQPQYVASGTLDSSNAWIRYTQNKGVRGRRVEYTYYNSSYTQQSTSQDFNAINSDGISSTSADGYFSISSAAPSSDVTFRVGTRDGGGNYKWTQMYSVLTRPTYCEPPTVASKTPNSVTLTWRSQGGMSQDYNIHKNGSNIGIIAPAPMGYTNTYTVTGLAPGQTNDFRVYTVNNSGSAKSSVTTTTTPNVGVPTISAVTANSPTSSKITWNNPGNVTGYKIYRKLNSGIYEYLATISGADTLTYDDTTIVPSTQSANNTYGYKVSGIYVGYESSYSAEKTFVAPTIGAPTGLTFSNVTPKTLTLNWIAPGSNAVKYNVYRIKSGESSFTKMTSSPISATSYNDSNLDASTQSTSAIYQYYVTGVDANNVEGQSSATATQTMPKVGVPELTTPASIDITTSSVKLTWSNPGNVSFYKVFRGTSPTDISSLIYTSPNASTTTYTNTALSTATKYYYKVVGVYTYNTTDYEGQTTSDNTKEVTTKSTAPTGLTVGARTSSSIALSWTAPGSAVNGYNIYEKRETGSYIKVNTTPVAGTTFNDTGLAANTQYTYNLYFF